MVGRIGIVLMCACVATGCEGLHSEALAECGNGETERAEACDDGFTDACGECNTDCSGPGTGAACGDGQLCPQYEACDDGFTDACGDCNADCTDLGSGSMCGDGAVCPQDEACDDGFTDACGTCNADCTGPGFGSECGDGVLCPRTEVCDDGFRDPCGSCNATCTGPGSGAVCGDSAACPELETCDDGFTDACGSCNADCTAEGSGSVCGDGDACPETEACDWGEGCYGCTPVIYVDASAPPGGTGDRWADALRYLPDALTVATAVNGPAEVWVAAGEYRPDLSDLGNTVIGDPLVAFAMPSSVRVVGGLAPGQLDRGVRDLIANETILTADLLGNDVGDGNRDDNCENVVRFRNCHDSELDGFTIRGAVKRGVSIQDSTNVRVTHCAVADNTGGGLYVRASSLVLSDSSVVGNSVSGENGGGMWLRSDWRELPVAVVRSEFAGNISNVRGGGLAADDPISIAWSLFSRNTSFEHGGGLYAGDVVTVMHTAFVGNFTGTGNWDDQYGGGAYVPVGNFSDCLFSGNVAEGGGGGLVGGSVFSSTFYGNISHRAGGPGAFSQGSVINSIFVANSSPAVGIVAVQYSCSSEVTGGGSNISECQPLFVDPDGPDDILGTPDDDLRLLPGSPGIDVGTNAGILFDLLDVDGDGDTAEAISLDLDGNPRVAGGGESPVVDMGAYELQP